MSTAPALPSASPALPFGVPIGELAEALGSSPSSVKRAVERREIPDAEARTEGGHRRWSVASAAAIVRAAGRAVPRGWEAEPVASAVAGES